MFKKILIIGGLIVTSNAFAQAENFSGFSVGLNTGFNSNTVVWNTDTSSSGNSIEIGRQNTPFNINASYIFALSQSATLGLGANYDLTNTKFVSSSVSDSFTLNGTIKNHYSLNLEPGYAFNEKTLGYVKVTYESATLVGAGTSTTISKSISGYGYGFGTRYLIDKNLFLNLEMLNANFTKLSTTVSGTAMTITPKMLSATIGIGYKF